MEPTTDDLLVAAFVILTALVAFIAVLYLNRKGAQGDNGKKDIADVDEGATGTVLVEEAGRVVRRSTRQHKAPPSDDIYPRSPGVPKTPRSTKADAAAATPVTATRTPRSTTRATSPAATRGRKATAKSPGPGRRATKSPAPAAGGASTSPATTPRRASRRV